MSGVNLEALWGQTTNCRFFSQFSSIFSDNLQIGGKTFKISLNTPLTKAQKKSFRTQKSSI